MSLADQIAADVVDVFLETEDFAESIRYFPKGGAERGITVVRVTLSLYRAQRQRQMAEDAHHLREENELAFFVSRDPEGGMPDPRIGDAIRISTDGPDERWDFLSIEDSDLCSFIVVFRKARIHRHGQLHPAKL